MGGAVYFYYHHYGMPSEWRYVLTAVFGLIVGAIMHHGMARRQYRYGGKALPRETMQCTGGKHTLVYVDDEELAWLNGRRPGGKELVINGEPTELKCYPKRKSANDQNEQVVATPSTYPIVVAANKPEAVSSDDEDYTLDTKAPVVFDDADRGISDSLQSGGLNPYHGMSVPWNPEGKHARRVFAEQKRPTYLSLPYPSLPRSLYATSGTISNSH